MPDNILTIYILNVGQGDTSVIKTPKGNYVIIDAFCPDKLVNLLGKIGLKKGDSIEEMIITHPHSDHFDGASCLLTDYKVQSVTLAPFWNKFCDGPPSYLEMINIIGEQKLQVDFVSGYSRIYPDGASDKKKSGNPLIDDENLSIEIIGPSNSMISQLERDEKLNVNHLSIMARLNWNRFRIIFAADAQMENWSCFDSEGMLDKSCHILRTAHHGSCNGTQWERIDRLDPKYIIISSDPSKRHHLPDVVGSSIFAKYAADNKKSKIVALTKDTGSIKISAYNENKYSVYSFYDSSDKFIDLNKEQKLTAANNPTNWPDLLSESIKRIYN